MKILERYFIRKRVSGMSGVSENSCILDRAAGRPNFLSHPAMALTRAGAEKIRTVESEARNALFPLPPTGLASFFCATSGCAEIRVDGGQVLGHCLRVDFSFNERH